MYRKSFREVLEEETREHGEMRELAERMGVISRDGRILARAEELEAASFYHTFCFYRT